MWECGCCGWGDKDGGENEEEEKEDLISNF